MSAAHSKFFFSVPVAVQALDLSHLDHDFNFSLYYVRNNILMFFRSNVQLLIMYCTSKVSPSMNMLSGIKFTVVLSRSLKSISTVHF